MNNIRVITFVLMFWFCSCNSNQKHDVKSPEQTISYAAVKVFEFPIKKFSLPYNLPLRLDSNSIIYLMQVPFDTSYLLHITNQGSKQLGVCYFVLPSHHQDLEDFSDEDHELLFFDGFSFALDNKQWDMLKRKTNETILNMPDSSNSSSQCLHCPAYVLYYNNQERSTGNSKLQANFKAYDLYIRDSLIHPMLAKRNDNK
jgi:hypothetical protein